MKVSYKKIRCNKNWNLCIVDSYYQLSAADFISEEELTQNHVFTIIQHGKIRRGEIKPTSDSILAFERRCAGLPEDPYDPWDDDDSDLCSGCDRDSCYGCNNLYPSIRFDME